MSKEWPGPQRGWSDGRWGGREEESGRRAGPGQEGLWDFVSGGRYQSLGSQGPGKPYARKGTGSSGVPVTVKERCLTSPCPGGQDGPCERHTNEPSPAERLTRSPLSLIKVASHVYSVPVKPISCESVIGPAFDWILVNSELLK